MNYRYHQSFKVEKDEDRFKVIAQCKRYGSMGPDPGREVWRETIVENVSREYADMLQRELTKSQFEDNDGRENIFTAARTLRRWIDTVCYDSNADQIALLPGAVY